ncbi:hypothetical protein EB796_022522 [Bugula neritina]|uniref:Uncharacterized protein n=1 Tax=Bugula neritina TaxID=10212 RepID=A0A7J7IZ97_BUGNE|nr:hypothetical protein EB796_022522 [Bugula neritina]
MSVHIKYAGYSITLSVAWQGHSLVLSTMVQITTILIQSVQVIIKLMFIKVCSSFYTFPKYIKLKQMKNTISY